MSKRINRAKAARYVIAALALLAVITIWPLRIWQREVTRAEPDGARTHEGAVLNDETDAVQRFVAGFDRLGSVDIWFYSFEHGRYISFSIINENYDMIYSSYVDMNDEELPGFVRIPVNVELEPGSVYTVMLLGCYSTYEIGVQVPSEWEGFTDSRELTQFYVHDTEVPGQVMAIRFNYAPPLGKEASLLIMGIILAIAAYAFVVLIRAEKRDSYAGAPLPKGEPSPPPAGAPLPKGEVVSGDGEHTIPLGKLLRAVLLPVTALFFAALFVFNLLKFYNDSVSEIFFLAVGIAIACVLLMALIINLTREEVPLPKPEPLSLIRRGLLMIAIAFIIMFSCEYMNGLFDIDHQTAERKIAGAFSAILILMVIPDGKKKAAGTGVRLTGYGMLTIALFASLVLFRNGRMWGVALVVFFTLFYITYALSKNEAEWTRILAYGLTLHFVCSVIYCMLFRVFAGFVSARYSFVFHTVTVTAEYLTMMSGVAAALLIASISRKGGGMGTKYNWYAPWLLFGTVGAYAVFTMSRTAYLSIGVTCVFMLAVTALKRGGAVKLLALMVSAVIICFPAVFAMQRILPSMVNRADVFIVEDTSSFLKGAAAWDHPHYMTLERFTKMFNEKILNRKSGPYTHPIDKYNYDENANPLYGPNGIPIDEWVPAPEEEEMTANSGFDIEQFSNGRLDIWRRYLKEMNLTGHEEMGVELPGGEIAVHAHNSYIQAAFDNGIVAGVVFILFVGIGICYGVVYYIRRNSRRGIDALPLALVTGFSLAALTEWVFLFSNPMTLGMLFGMAPLIMRFRNGKQRREQG